MKVSRSTFRRGKAPAIFGIVRGASLFFPRGTTDRALYFVSASRSHCRVFDHIRLETEADGGIGPIADLSSLFSLGGKCDCNCEVLRRATPAQDESKRIVSLV